MSGERVSGTDGGRTEPSAQAGPKARIPDCPLARTVGIIGPWWTLEILHEILDGHDRFEAVRRNLETPAEVLRERMDQLVTRGLLDTEDAAAAPEDRTYRPTDNGRALRPLILAMAAYGNHRLCPQDRSLIVVDAATGTEADPVVVDRVTGRRLDTADFLFARGPRASEAIAARYPQVPERR
ncbi:helix-turn-helix domain-containing protein [Streptomyces sp. NPDC096030]|uniref:winged helix-turn-helix transcriptional regulator n=1 Tax=Streptomyces sp. NPDC096030 TaxID=3155423 RepID=UPI0033261406